MIIHHGTTKKAVNARFEWSEYYDNEKKTIRIKIYDLWGNYIFQTLKRLKVDNANSSSWLIMLPNNKVIINSRITAEISRRLKVNISSGSLSDIFNNLDVIIRDNKQTDTKSKKYQFTKKLIDSEFAVKIIFD